MSKVDKLKERLVSFVKEENSENSLMIPNRVICGFKLEIVAMCLQDLLRDKYHKELKFVDYEDKETGYIFNFK
jgi:hypothetical protein